jgi:hypothetical protein
VRYLAQNPLQEFLQQTQQIMIKKVTDLELGKSSPPTREEIRGIAVDAITMAVSSAPLSASAYLNARLEIHLIATDPVKDAVEQEQPIPARAFNDLNKFVDAAVEMFLSEDNGGGEAAFGIEALDEFFAARGAVIRAMRSELGYDLARIGGGP